jgi:tetratricopeptide (TPR) repeat protein
LPGHLAQVIDPQLASAAIEARAAQRAGRADAHDLTVLALHAAASDDPAGAQALFDKALALEPGNPATLTGLAKFLRAQGRVREAVLACDEAIRTYPEYPDAWLERGAILTAGGSGRAARACFETAAALAPDNSTAQAGIAALAARDGDGEAARRHAARALALDPGNLVAASALATVLIEAGDAAAARTLLEPLIARHQLSSSDRSLAYGHLGDACHRLGDHAAAHAAFVASKADFAAAHAPLPPGQLGTTDRIEAIIEAVQTIAPAPSLPAETGTEAPATHVFLIGHPRSGTTLMENVLASLPGASALEERPLFAQADRSFLMGDHGAIAAGLDGFSRLDSTALEALRKAYWTKAFESGIDPASRLFIDMDPMKATRLPFIARLFPGAKILIMRRDPRDVVWSCFRTNFAVNSNTLDFTSLERAARHYDALMRLTQSALERLRLEAREVHYHQLVQDFDATTRAVCAFLGLEWSEELRRFDRTARQRGVSTASVGQVRRGLYDGTRQWEPYADYLAPVMPILRPWIERFGYA